MTPKKTLQIAAEYFDLLEDLARKSYGVTLSTLHNSLWITKPDHPKSVQEVAKLLSDNGLLMPSPEADGEWEIPPAVTDFVLHLAKRQHLRRPGELRGLLHDLEEEIGSFARLVLARDPKLINSSALRIVNSIQRAQRLSAEHHDAVLAAVTSIKTREDQRSVRERFSFIKDLFELHIVPMQQLVDSDGVMQRQLDRLLVQVREAEPLVDVGGFSTPVSRMKAHVLQLKRDAQSAFRESYNEVLPLYNALRQDHELAAAAAAMLDGVSRQGFDAWDIGEHLSLCSFKPEHLFTDYALEDHLFGIQQYVEELPAPLITLETAGIERMADPLLVDDVLEDLHRAGPVPDILRWLFECYPEHGETDLLCAYMDIAEAHAMTTQHADTQTQAVYRGVIYDYYPLGLRHAPAH